MTTVHIHMQNLKDLKEKLTQKRQCHWWVRYWTSLITSLYPTGTMWQSRHAGNTAAGSRTKKAPTQTNNKQNVNNIKNNKQNIIILNSAMCTYVRMYKLTLRLFGLLSQRTFDW